MPHAGAQAVTTKYHAVLYLRGTEDKQLDDAERRCRDYASQFGWHVMETIRDSKPCTTPGQNMPTRRTHPVDRHPRNDRTRPARTT